MSKIKLIITSLMLLIISLVFIELCIAADEADVKKAEKLHESAATSSVVHLKAIYYQNNEIIGLLKEIRDLLNSIRSESALSKEQ